MAKRVNGWKPEDWQAWQAIAGRFGIPTPRPERDISGNPIGKVPGSPAPDAVPLAYDPAYISQVGANNLGYSTALSQLPGQLNSASADYGYTVNYKPGTRGPNGEIDPNDPTSLGSYEIGGIDPSNPNSRAALLQRAYENEKRGDTTSMAARGQLYSGALQSQLDEAGRNNQAQTSANQRSFSDLIGGYFNNATGARVGAIGGNAQAFGDLVGRQPPAPSTVTYAGVPYTPATTAQPFAAPAPGFAPTPESVLAAKSLLGTDITKKPPASYYRPKKRR